MIHIGFTGTRHGMTKAQRASARAVLLKLTLGTEATAHHGMCVGADEEFDAMAQGRCERVEGHPSDMAGMTASCRVDSAHAPKRPLVRNADIVRAATVMIAAPAQAMEQQRGGTWSTIRLARRDGKPLAIVMPDGTVVKERWP